MKMLQLQLQNQLREPSVNVNQSRECTTGRNTETHKSQMAADHGTSLEAVRLPRLGIVPIGQRDVVLAVARIVDDQVDDLVTEGRVRDGARGEDLKYRMSLDDEEHGTLCNVPASRTWSTSSGDCVIGLVDRTTSNYCH
jgi:hypothetical protein